ncbi:MAG TPA: hypothetical protein P5270_05735 [Victivallales bacterium]|nr:hypothetical protein [Victivallales bacterium]HRR28846.1 hypothetical protein [Victivallales bacterium]
MSAVKPGYVYSHEILEMREIRKKVPAHAKCFYWEGDIAGNGSIYRECDAIKMNYQLYPAIVRYRYGEMMLDSQYIITQTGMNWMLNERLTELFARTGKDTELETIFIGKRYIVFRVVDEGAL